LIDLDDIHVEFATDLVGLVLDPVAGLETRIARIRAHLAAEFGFITPPVRLTDNGKLSRNEYVIRVQGVEAACSRLYPDKVLIIADETRSMHLLGEDVMEPVYGAPARWIDRALRDEAIALGLAMVEPSEVLATHLLETIKANFGRLLTRRVVRTILDEYAKPSDPTRAAANRRLLDEFIPDKTPIDLVQAVFRLLLDEGVSIRNIPLVLEATAEARTTFSGPELIAEYVRQKLARQIISPLRNADGELPLIQLAPYWEETFAQREVDRDGRSDIALAPEEFNRLAQSVSAEIRKATAHRIYPAVVTFSTRRRFVRAVLAAKGIRNPVLSYDEIDPLARPKLVGIAA
jgi:flagellar biosynthesis protein FlhA